MNDHLDPIALSVADLAYVNEGGPAAERVAAAITAYPWAFDQVKELEGMPGFTVGPSYASWRDHRATLPEKLR